MNTAIPNLPRNIYLKSALRWLPAIAFFSGALVFSIFYLTSSRTFLLEWFANQNPCFYGHKEFALRYLNEANHAAGIKYCVLAIFICIAGLLLIFRKIKNSPHPATASPAKPLLGKQDAPYVTLILAVAIGFWCWGTGTISPAVDEIYSAVICSGDHPFHTLSYYMIPNNHILFNMINNTVFHFVADRVMSGRLISLGAYLVMGVWLFPWLRDVLESRKGAVLITLLLLLQLPVWIFAFQARGYELCLLEAWVTYISYTYYIREAGNKWLYVHTISIVAGYATVPTFMYMHAAIVLFAFAGQLHSRKVDYRYCRYQLAALGMVFLSYLPALSFSGIGAFVGTKYTAPRPIPFGAFFTECRETMIYFIRESLINISTMPWIDYLLFLLPLSLFLVRDKKAREKSSQALFFIALWVSVFTIVVVMKRAPFLRNMVAHFSIGLAFSLIALFTAGKKVAALTRKAVVAPVLYTTIAALFLAAFIYRQKQSVGASLYGTDVNRDYETITNGFRRSPVHGKIGCTDANFYFYYFLKMHSYNIVKCMDGDEDFIIKGDEEAFPDALLQRYTVQSQILNCTIYKRKEAAIR